MTEKFRVGIMTLSDKGSLGEREDLSGPIISRMLSPDFYEVSHTEILPDDLQLIELSLVAWIDERGLDLIITTGGTGVSPRDITPEATRAVISFEIPGMAEAMRSESLKVTHHAMLSRAIVGVRGSSIIVNLPGSPKGASENLGVILPALPHALRKLKGDPEDCATT
jgi:molybdopterin adenylyltransferase